jgi:GAF domain-containing protein
MNYRHILRDTSLGVAFGLLFPIAASLLQIYLTQGEYTLSGFWLVQSAYPLLWIIDTAPLFLGLFAYMVGLRAARIDRIKTALEQKSRERSQMLEQLESMRIELERKVSKQVNELKASAQVGRTAASIYDHRQLMNEVVELISTQFGFYHAGIFLIDEAGEFAILQAANSEGGKRMLSRGHKLPVGKLGIVGYVAERGEPRIALDVGQDTTFFNNPELPQTRSEMALPLKAGGEIFGVLDVQSVESSAFADEDVEVLQLMADQVALAIQNARLIEESRRAIQELENLYKEQVRQDWKKKLSVQVPAYRYDRLGVEPASVAQFATTYNPDDQKQLQVLLMLRGERLGVILLRREEDQPAWSADEKSLAQEAAGYVAAALENARLFEDAQTRAAREQALSQLTAQLTHTVNIDNLLKRAVQELSHLPDVAEVSIQIGATHNGS